LGALTTAEPEPAIASHLAGFQEAIQYYERILAVPPVQLTPEHLIDLVHLEAIMLADLQGDRKYLQIFGGNDDFESHARLQATRVALAQQTKTLPPWEDLIVDSQGYLIFIGHKSLLLVFVSAPLSPEFQKALRHLHQCVEEIFGSLFEREALEYFQLVGKLANRMLGLELLQKPLLLTNRELVRDVQSEGMDAYYSLDLLYSCYEARLESQGFPLKFLLQNLPQKHLGLNQKKMVECVYTLMENGYLILEEPHKLRIYD
jgi:hypothetical protein